MERVKHFGLRIQESLLKKFRIVCRYEGRSANSQMLHLIRRCVEDCEKEHGVQGDQERGRQ